MLARLCARGISRHTLTGMQGPRISIDGEHETDHGWLYTLTVTGPTGATSDHELTLAWVDHEHLVSGLISPSLVARASGELALKHFGVSGLPQRFDVSSLRRLIGGFDDQVRSMINAPL